MVENKVFGYFLRFRLYVELISNIMVHSFFIRNLSIMVDRYADKSSNSGSTFSLLVSSHKHLLRYHLAYYY